MVEASRHDAWQAGDSYDAYMGRWSRKIAPRFVTWLGAPHGLDWLDIGCGTGVLSQAILAEGAPSSLIAIDPSESFVAAARRTAHAKHADFRVGDGLAPDLPDASRDVIVSGLVLNFLPDRARALAQMTRVARAGGRIGFYVWDYPGGGLEFLRAFWREAVALDPEAADLTEARRFPDCTPEALRALAERAGLAEIACAPIEVETVFADFDDFWHPFTLGAGPAPGYVGKLARRARAALHDRLEEVLPPGRDGRIAMSARAWALKGRARRA